MKRLASVIRDLLLTAGILFLLALVVLRLDAGRQEQLAGLPNIIDGDTLVLEGRRIRLAGIDAPELHQVCRRDSGPWPCGLEARDMLAGLTEGSKTTCLAGALDRYGRTLAVCSAGGRELNARMVGSGYAIAFGSYEADEREARQQRRGLWAGTFDAPGTWRRTHAGVEEAQDPHDDWIDMLMMRVGAWLETRLSGVWNG